MAEETPRQPGEHIEIHVDVKDRGRVGKIIGKVVQVVSDNTRLQPTPQHRETLAENVWEFWIDGVLNRSLYQEVLIELGMTTQPEMVNEQSWEMVLQLPLEKPSDLDPGTKMIDLFDAMNGELLILGEPGGGKTTALLQLARELLGRYRADRSQSVPVILNLSTWNSQHKENPKFFQILAGFLTRLVFGKQERLPFAEWVADELAKRYRIRRKYAEAWIEHDALIFLLDGLDEVEAMEREACIQAINAFRDEYLVPVVVCSRFADYESLPIRLNLAGAVLLQPLSSRQIQEYLGRTGLESIRELFSRDPSLMETANTPLMLNVMTMAFHDGSMQALKLPETVEAQRRFIFDAYIGRMLARRQSLTKYSAETFIHTLGWVAGGMAQRNQTGFYLEAMDLSWLPKAMKQQARMVFGSIVGVLGAIAGALVGWLGDKLTSQGPFGGEGLLVLFAVLGCLGSALLIVPYAQVPDTKRAKGSWSIAIAGLIWWASMGPLLIFIGCLCGSLVIGLIGGSISMYEWGGLGGIIGVTIALILSVLMAMEQSGGMAALTNLVARYVMWRTDYCPWNIRQLLENAVERIFLRKVGHGYIFIHRLLLEHFAFFMPQHTEIRELIIERRTAQLMAASVLILGVLSTYQSGLYHTILGNLQNEENPAIAYTYSLQALKQNPANAHYLYNVCVYGLQVGHVTDALAACESAAHLKPDVAQYWDTLCGDFSEAGYAADVLRFCDEAVALHPDHTGIRYDRAFARLLTQDERGALEDFRIALVLETEQGDTPVPTCIEQREQMISEIAAGIDIFGKYTLDEIRSQCMVMIY